MKLRPSHPFFLGYIDCISCKEIKPHIKKGVPVYDTKLHLIVRFESESEHNVITEVRTYIYDVAVQYVNHCSTVTLPFPNMKH